jgi:molybdate transport system permease protein
VGLLARELMRGRIAVAVIAAIGLLFLGVPVFVILIRGSRATSAMPGVAEALALSIITTAFTALLTVIFGTPLAYVFARWRFPLKRLLNLLIELPIILPPAVAGLALLATFGRRGVFGSLLSSIDVSLPFTTAAVVLAQTFVSAPFYIRAALVGFQSVPPEIEDAARVDGAAGLPLFLYVSLPLARRALGAGLILSWARALGEFGATILFAGSLQGRTQTMPLLIYNVLERDIDAALWTGLILVVVALIALSISQWLARKANDEDLLQGSG